MASSRCCVGVRASGSASSAPAATAWLAAWRSSAPVSSLPLGWGGRRDVVWTFGLWRLICGFADFRDVRDLEKTNLGRENQELDLFYGMAFYVQI